MDQSLIQKNFFTQENCTRCGQKLNVRIMSRMNTDTLCIECAESEKSHPLYAVANEAEASEVRKGNYNYPGLFAGQVYPNFKAN